MASGKMTTGKAKGNATDQSIESRLWAAADKMRSHMDPAEYKHVVLGLIFLKYISDSFQERYETVKEDPYSDPEDRDEYTMENVFWVPQEARFSELQKNSKQTDIGKRVDDAMRAIELENHTLKGILKKDYSSSSLDSRRLGELIDLIASIGFKDGAGGSKDVLGRIYQYFLSKFASAEGKGGGEFYTPDAIVELLVKMIEPYRGQVYDPACGSGGMFVMSDKFAEAHGANRKDLSIFGQESNPTTWKLCKMNLAIRGLSGNLGPHHADTFHNDLHPDLKADYILANPPFNISDWGGEQLQENVRWTHGVPPKGNANYGWVQHMVHHLSPTGVAGFVLANGSLTSNTGGEGEIRKNIVEADLVDCIVAMPAQLFYTTQIPVCLWFLARDKRNSGFRDRHGETLFIDARNLGFMAARTHRDLSEEDMRKITDAYHAWRGERKAIERQGEYEDVPGFCKSASLAEIRKNVYVLTPGRYVGAAAVEYDREPFAEKIKRLAARLEKQLEQSLMLETEIRANLREVHRGLGFLSDKIESNNLMNETLEQILRAIFKSWFIDFDPVRDREKGLVPYGMSPEIAELFPENFESSELGEIPMGWNVESLGDILQSRNERVKDRNIAEYSCTNHGLFPRSERFNKQLSKTSSSNKVVRKGDFVFGLSRKVLNFGLMRDKIGCVSPAYKVYAVNESVVKADILERTMRSNPQYFYGAVSSSSREGQSISVESLSSLKFCCPPQDVQKLYSANPMSLFADHLSKTAVASDDHFHTRPASPEIDVR